MGSQATSASAVAASLAAEKLRRSGREVWESIMGRSSNKKAARRVRTALEYINSNGYSTVQVLPELNSLPRSGAGDLALVASIWARTLSV